MMRISLFVIVFSLVGCVDELDVTTERVLQVLVVEGSIDTNPGPHYVSLSKSAKFGSIFEDFSKKVNGALVRIRDEKGNQVILDEVDSGVYATSPSFQAKVGSEYTLIVESNTERYISIPEKVMPVAPIQSLRLEPKKLASLSDVVFEVGVEVYVDFQDPGDEQNFYLIENIGIHVVHTSPERFELKVPGGFIPYPKDCCAECWVTEMAGDPTVRITSDDRFNGNEASELAAFIVDDGKRYTDKYLVKILQHSLTKEAFRFFQVLESQLSITGELFDPPPATLRGNVINVIEPTSLVIGYFYATDVSIDSVFIDNALVEESLKIPFDYPDDCRELPHLNIGNLKTIVKSSSQRPLFW